jgi:transketolase
VNRSCREAFGTTLAECAATTRDIVVVTSDSRGSSLLAPVAAAIGDRFIEVGIAEQNAVGIGAGLASCGKNVFVCGPASFHSARSLEQVKNDVAYSRMNVKIVAVSGGVAYGNLGSTHHSLHDIAVYRAIPDIAIVIPSDARQAAAATRYLASSVGACYFRMGRRAVPPVYPESADDTDVFRFGSGNLLRRGADMTVVACGELVDPALEAARLLEADGISIRVIDIPTVKPLDEKIIEEAAKETGAILTVEEHSVHGGLGAAIAELCVERHPVPMRLLGLPDEPAYIGSQQEIFEHYRLTPEGIRDEAIRLMERT